MHRPIHRSGLLQRFAILAALGGVLTGPGCSKSDEPKPEEAPVATTEAEGDKAEAEEAKPEPPAEEAKPEGPVSVAGQFETPESILHDEEMDYYLVSNIQGAPLDVDGNGFISKVSPEGKVLELKWIDGTKEGVELNAPKGMAIQGGVLYVSDISAVRMFDAATGAPKGSLDIEGATFLNDIALGPDGTVYVSDSGLKAGEKGFEPSGSDAVYKIVDGKAEVVIKDKELPRPNGLLVDGEQIWVAGFGANELFSIKDGKKDVVKTLPKGSLDGIVKLPDGRLLVASWEGQTVYVGTPDGEFTALVTGVEAPADISYDKKRNRLLIPLFNGNSLRFEPVAAKAEAEPAGDAPSEKQAPEESPKADST